MIHEEIDDNLSIEKNLYRVKNPFNSLLLKRIYISKKPLSYAFIGGMWYSKKEFSLKQDISLPYPFSTYYTTKILDKWHNNVCCRSLFYVKMPVMVLQFDHECICIEFDPVITCNNFEIIPFISLFEKDDTYCISFYLFNEFFVIEKEHAWLGFGEKKKKKLDLKQGDVFNFNVCIKKFNTWDEAVLQYADHKLPEEIKIDSAKKVFQQAKQGLFRSYDHLTGSFLQLPWKDTPGFTFVNSSYSLLSYEAVRLHYFSEWFSKTADKQFEMWRNGLRNLFVNKKLYKTSLTKGHGLVWYNMTNLTKKGLEGFFYMDCGYSGYPGGQSTTAFHLLKYLSYCEDTKIKGLVEKSLEYIVSTQNENGSWPMAIRQEGMLQFRLEDMSKCVTHGGTAESVRALLMGYKMFADEAMKDAAYKGLLFLQDRNPICYNGLRDIGINEAEAFSAVSCIDAFLDAYEDTKKEKYKEFAVLYGMYCLPWLYWYDTKNLKLKFNFHPISYSITPRLSPYESVWIVSTFLRLHHYSKNAIWKKVATALYNEAVAWVSSTGGLCEGVFPRFLESLYCLPMEQTFATVELLHASSHFFDIEKKGSDTKIEPSDPLIQLVQKDNCVVVFYKDSEVLRFNAAECRIVFLKGVSLNKYGISFSFPKAYDNSSKLKMLVKKHLRGKYTKFILSIADVKYFLQGVHAPKISDKIKIDMLKNHIKSWDVSIDKGVIRGWCQTSLHKISYTISFCIKDKKFLICFNPLVIEVLDHDVAVPQVLFPVIGSSLLSSNNEYLEFDGCIVRCENNKIIMQDTVTAVDQTYVTNWTHGGVFQGKFDIILKNA
jgi:hypothetical protein